MNGRASLEASDRYIDGRKKKCVDPCFPCVTFLDAKGKNSLD